MNGFQINVILSRTIVPLQGYDQEGRYTVLVRPGLIPPAKLPINDLIKVSISLTGASSGFKAGGAAWGN